MLFILKIILSFAIPGASLLFTSKPARAVCIPTIFIVTLATFTETRAIASLYGFTACIIILAGVHTISFLGGIGSFSRPNGGHYIRSAVLFSFIILFMHGAIVKVFYSYRNSVLGLELYYIPSQSMQPTIQPGDVVLADTRPNKATLKVGDIVVFQHPYINGLAIIKRISSIVGDGTVSVSGDNPENSLDSRTLGNIDISAIQAKATAVFRGATLPLSLNR